MLTTEQAFRILNMRSALDRQPTELTAATRIVDAALEVIAERGLRGATVRDIAAAADVSPALVVHHFGSKDGVREACDARVVAFIARKSAAHTAPGLDETFTRFGRYAARVLADGDERSASLFDALLRQARSTVEARVAAGELHASADPEALAVALVTLGLAPFTLAPLLGRWAGGSADDAIARIGVPLAEIYTRGLFTDGAVLAQATGMRGARS